MAIHTQPAIPADLVRVFHLCAALRLCESAILKQVRAGKLPKADGRNGNAIWWRLASIRRINPALANAIEHIQQIPKAA